MGKKSFLESRIAGIQFLGQMYMFHCPENNLLSEIPNPHVDITRFAQSFAAVEHRLEHEYKLGIEIQLELCALYCIYHLTTKRLPKAMRDKVHSVLSFANTFADYCQERDTDVTPIDNYIINRDPGDETE